MKKTLSIILSLMMLLSTFSFSAHAKKYTDVYMDGKLTDAITAQFESGDAYICLEDMFEYYDFEIEPRSSYVVYDIEYVDISCNLDDDDYEERLISFCYDSDDKSGELTFWEEGVEFFSLSTKKDEYEYELTKPVIRLGKEEHYVYYKDIERFLGFDLVAAPEINSIAIYHRKKVPGTVTLYGPKGEAVKASTFFEDEYISAGYKKDLKDVAIIPESKKVPADGIKVSLNGGLLEFDVVPTTINGRTMVPLRAIFEALSATVEWQEETKTVVSKKDDTTVKLTLDSDEMKVNARTVTLDCPATEIGGRTLVPVRAISEAFGLDVDWDDSNQLVILREEKYSDIETTLLYNLQGQVVEVPEYDLDSFKNDGWLTEKPVIMYAMDGRTQLVAQADVAANQQVGWYVYPPVQMYAPDGRTQVVPQADVAANQAVGWYTYPVTVMYAKDGRTITISTSEVQNYKSVGWYTASQYFAMQYKYLAGSDFRSIRTKYSNAVANGAYLYPYTDKNGDSCIMIYISYKIISNYHAYYLHNISKGTTIENAPDYYDRIADQYWGNSKLHYLDLKIEALGAEIKAAQGILGEIDTGIFVDPYTLNL